MYGILAAGKPIVAVAPRECDVVAIGERKGFSTGTDPDNPSEFIEAVRGLSRNAGQLQAMTRAALAAAPEYQSGAEQKKLVRILEETATR